MSSSLNSNPAHGMAHMIHDLQHDPHLRNQLKQLRLSGILETLEVRVRQAIDEQMSYVDFLQRLIEDEVERRHHKQLQLRVRRANFQTDKTLERFDFSFNPQLNRQVILDLATCQFVARKQPVVIVGPSGVGKSHLSQALGWEACKRGYDVVYASCAKLLASLAAGRVDGSYERRLQAVIRPDLLILDDFGLKPLRSPAPEDMYDIINERYEKGATLITSNRALSEFPAMFGDPLLASAGLDRLLHNAYVVVIGGASFRARNRNADPSLQVIQQGTLVNPKEVPTTN
jgi:DNA replication protein DnaC